MWSYEIDEEQRLVMSTAWDELTSAYVSEHQRNLTHDTRFNRKFFQLVDFTRVTAMALDHVAVRSLSREHIFSKESRRAFVAPTPLAWGLSRMIITLRELSGGEEKMEVFKSHDDALLWLYRDSL